MDLRKKDILDFQAKMYAAAKRRSFPWRKTHDPYCIFISEVMLQQTQVARVIQKYNKWLTIFPNFQKLSSSKFPTVLTHWSGLGYNRRAKFLLESSKIIINQYNGILPDNPDELVKLPGIGKATAASIIVFSYNKPLVFIETNIRRVFIHEFFQDQTEVQDKDILELVKQTLDPTNPREWYYALMDYGSYLGKTIPNPNRKSKTYSKQSKFEGSLRQIRGLILKQLIVKGKISIDDIQKMNPNHQIVQKVIDALMSEKIIVLTDGFVELAA